jgi:hypothetical protein
MDQFSMIFCKLNSIYRTHTRISLEEVKSEFSGILTDRPRTILYEMSG